MGCMALGMNTQHATRLHTHEAMTMDKKARRSGRFDLQASLFQLRPTVLQDR
jgi:hypothetical protein